MISIDDATAIYIVKTIAQTRLKSASSVPSTPDLTNPQLRNALYAAFDRQPQPTASEGELARAALDLLAQDPAYAEPIMTMVNQSGNAARPQSYIDPTGIALTTAVLLVLQTRMKFKVDQTGKWSVEVEKKSAGDSAVKILVQRLLSFFGR